MVTVSSARNDSLVLETIGMTLQIRQKPGTEKQLTDYLSQIKTDKDTLYAILYEPTFCPRCEVAIRPDRKMLKDISPQSPFILITSYPDSARAERYNREKEYDADGYIYDTGKRFLDIFSFNSNGLSGIYLLKMCKSRGELLAGAISFYTSMDYIEQLVAWDKRMPTQDFSAAADGRPAESWQTPTPECSPIRGGHTDYTLATGTEMLSDVYDIPKFDGRYFYYNDKLNNCVMLFKLEGDSLCFKSRIEPDSAESRHFIYLPEETYQSISKSSLFYIPLATTMTDSTHIGVSYSLPNVLPDTISKREGVLAFFNAPAILIRNAETSEKQPLFAPDFMVGTDTTFFYHNFNYCIFKGDAIYGCQKLTWPLMLERETYEGKPWFDSFMPDFYDGDNPSLVAFSLKTGKREKLFAQLEPTAAASRTGYWFINTVMYSNGKELLYSDGFSGTIHITDDIRGGKVSDYSAFAVDTAAFPKPDTAMFYRREYPKIYNKYYYRSITYAKMNADKVLCIVQYFNPDEEALNTITDCDYTLVTIDRHTGLATERLLPHYPGMRPMGYGLRSAGGEIKPFGFYRRADGSYVVRVWDA